MVQDRSIPYRLFSLFNSLFLGILAFLCILPLIHVLAISVSDSASVLGNLVGLWPRNINFANYSAILEDNRFITAFLISLFRTVAGTALNMFLITLTAYPLYREAYDLKGRNVFMWFLVFPMLFSGGLIPTFILMRDLNLLDNYLALILPGAVPIFSVILMMNFFRGLPKALYEAAIIDGASHMRVLLKVFIPLSLPSIATLSLFSMVGHWNAWFDALIYMNDSGKWPLQTFLQSVIKQKTDVRNLMIYDPELLKKLNDRSMQAAQIFIATLPILCVYPFLQKYFVSGIVIGSVKE